jgi:ABC-2 type transport system permease protein
VDGEDVKRKIRSPITAKTLNKNWGVLWAMSKKELTLMARYPVNFLSSFIEVLLVITIFSLAGKMFSTPEEAGRASGIIFYGYILFIFIYDTLWTMAINLYEEQTLGQLEALYLTPANKFLHLASKATVLISRHAVAIITSSIILTYTFGKIPIHNIASGVLIFIFSLSATLGLGFIFAALSFFFLNSIHVVASFIQFALVLICAIFFPFKSLPLILISLAKLFPLSYSIDAFRSTMLGYPKGFPELAPIETEIAIIIVSGIFFPMVGFWIFKLSERKIRKTKGHGTF